MPITQSARKALRQNLRHRIKNLAYRSRIKSLIIKVKKLVLKKQTKEAQAMLPQIYKFLDKAAGRGLIKKNAAARTKSRIAKLINRK